MLHVGLTGNIGSGKSTVATLFARWGAVLIDADELVHQLQHPGTAVFAGIVRRFGADVVRPTWSTGYNSFPWSSSTRGTSWHRRHRAS